MSDISGMTNAAAFLTVNNTLICFDDLERKGRNLDMIDILGLVSLLKEQRNCKILIILNDESLQGKEKEEFSRHSEKLIDLELEFAQSSQEAFNCVFSKTDKYYDFIAEKCHKLDIDN